ncbi:MAG: class I SAM-dependent methyltransferase [Planctomycetota bacterium]
MIREIVQWFQPVQIKGIVDLDDPSATQVHGEILQQKDFLKRLYTDFYNQLRDAVPGYQNKIIVELGSGCGFIKKVIPNAVTSDILDLPGVDMVFSAEQIPFEDRSVDAFVMIDVLHHIADSSAFFSEAARCLKPSGRIVMIEPANTAMAKFIYKNFHHEDFDTRGTWGLEKQGPLSQGNGAIGWIIFNRDRKIFQQKFPDLKIVDIFNHTPFGYLLSGGFTLPQLLPGCCYPIIKIFEQIIQPANNLLGMFQTIKLQKA